jgi:hypothetical protein
MDRERGYLRRTVMQLVQDEALKQFLVADTDLHNQCDLELFLLVMNGFDKNWMIERNAEI